MYVALIDALVTGALYTVMALGLVTVFKATRVLNFAHGLISALCGYIAYEAAVVWEWPFPLAVMLAVVSGTAITATMDILLLSRLRNRTSLELVIATFGVSLLLEFVIIRVWGYEAKAIPVPFGAQSFHLAGVPIPKYGMAVVAVCLVVIAGLILLLTRTTIGLKLRATFDDPVAIRLTGVSAQRMRLLAWSLGGGLAGLAGALLAPLLFLSPTSMNVILIIAFAAAVVGGFSSLGGTAAGGLSVGLVLSLGGTYVSLQYRNLILYALIVVFLCLRPRGLFGNVNETESASEPSVPTILTRRLLESVRYITRAIPRQLPGRLSPVVIFHVVIVAIVVLAQPLLGPTWTLSLGSWLIDVIAASGLALILYYGGQFSFAQGAMMGAGGYIAAHVVASNPSSWPLALAVSVVVVALMSLMVGIPSARVRGPYFAALTLAIGFALPEVAYNWTSFTGGGNGLTAQSPTFGGRLLSSQNFYYVILICSLAVYIGLLALRNCRYGRRMVLAVEAPSGAASLGVSAYKWRVATFVIGSSLGALAGALAALQSGYVSPASYGLDSALLLFVAAVVGGSMTGSFWGAAVVVLIPIVFKSAGDYNLALQGIILIAVLYIQPRRLSNIDALRQWRTPQRSRGHDSSDLHAEVLPPAPENADESQHPIFTVTNGYPLQILAPTSNKGNT